jgi:hypothetical protein
MPKNLRFLTGCSALMLAMDANAHLMTAQNGILNVSGSYAYLAVSVPVSSFQFNDQDGDRLLSDQELEGQSSSIYRQISDGVELRQGEANLPKELAMISLNSEDGDHFKASGQLLAMFKFALPTSASCAASDSFKDIGLALKLYGNTKFEEAIEITIMLCGEKNRVTTDQFHPYAGLHRD